MVDDARCNDGALNRLPSRYVVSSSHWGEEIGYSISPASHVFEHSYPNVELVFILDWMFIMSHIGGSLFHLKKPCALFEISLQIRATGWDR